MKTTWHSVWDWMGMRCYGAHLALLAKADDYAHAPRQRKLMLASAAMTAGGLFLSTAAHADAGEGIAGMLNIAATQGTSIKASLGKLFAAGGFGAAGMGSYNWWRKGKEGEQSHIKGGQIFIPILAGAALGATGFMMIKAGESVGVSSSDHGVVPS
ncbi:hypothetical protein AAKU55_003049 [Oxalobacteraceae bacterium GrIS 1.11]